MPVRNKDSGEVPLTIFVPQGLKRRLGVIAASSDSTLKAIANQALINWLETHATQEESRCN